MSVGIYKQWEILTASIPNTDGSPPTRPHPCIYLGESQKRPGAIIVLGITSDLSQVDQWSVEMPWAVGGHPITGLDRPSLAQTAWIHHISPELVRRVKGITTDPEQHAIGRLINRRLKQRS